MEEIWRGIKGYREHYQISNFGSVKRLGDGKTREDKILKLTLTKSGYVTLRLTLNGISKTRRVDRLVAETFLGNIPFCHIPEIKHLDSDRSNNQVSNLVIIKTKHKMSRLNFKFSSEYAGVSWSNQSKKWVASIAIAGKSIYLGGYTDEICASNAYQKALADHRNGCFYSIYLR